jgi:hypothetical protein
MVIMLNAFDGSLFALCDGVALERPGQTSTHTCTLLLAWVKALKGHIKLKQLLELDSKMTLVYP